MIKKIRLHKYISDMLKQSGDYTNPEIQRNIEEYGVLVDESLIKNRLTWVFPNQKIEVSNWPQRQQGNFSAVKILKDCSEYMVIFKPINLVVEPGAGHQTNNLLTWLNNNSPETKFTLVHRLDKDTQGIMIVAKSDEDREFFQNQFRERSTTKKYLAIVSGLVEQNFHTTHFQSRDHLHPTRQLLFWEESKAMEYDKLSRNAETIIKPLCISKDLNQTLVEVQIKTGRMHQIRLVCESLGFPLVADKVYHKTINPTFISAQHVHTFYISEIQNYDTTAFSQLKNAIFGETEYCLLSNYLRINTQQNECLEVVWKDIDKLLS